MMFICSNLFVVLLAAKRVVRKEDALLIKLTPNKLALLCHITLSGDQ